MAEIFVQSMNNLKDVDSIILVRKSQFTERIVRKGVWHFVSLMIKVDPSNGANSLSRDVNIIEDVSH